MNYIWIIPLLPLLGFLINGLLANKLKFSEKLVGIVGSATIALAFLLSTFAVIEYSSWSKQPENREKPFISQQCSYVWLDGGEAAISEGKEAGKAKATLKVEWSYQLDRLSGLYLLFVTFVAFLIHLYAIGYMKGEEGFARFFAYLNLFMFMMLLLILGSNLLMLFVGWEGVGLCSYLLIGFYMKRNDAAEASKKAFVVNRIGDLGFILAIATIFAAFGSLSYSEIDSFVKQYPIETFGTFGLMSVISLGLLVGATGKSAQIPLFVWLPDAMAGPTPVSALIHAATMVTAGIFMLFRMNAILQRSLTMMLVVAVVGGLTALVAGTIAVTQRDIKKVLAYSTISQLGYMFLACGVGAFVAAVFHVVTHAFFKAQLFLGAGNVIHASHTQDLHDMGGLKKRVVQTYRTMMVGWLAICGIFPLAGFWSKDEILASSFSTHLFPHFVGYTLFFVGLVTSVITTFYMTRMMVLAFEGENRSDGHEQKHHHEWSEGSSKLMTFPLWILSVLTAISGLVLGFPPGHGLISNWLEPAVDSTAVAGAEHSFDLKSLLIAVVSFLCAVITIVLTRKFYSSSQMQAEEKIAGSGFFYRLSSNGWYWNRLVYEKLTEYAKRVNAILWNVDSRVVDGMPNGSAFLTRILSLVSSFFDKNGIDLFFNMVGWMTRAVSVFVRYFQTGLLNNYLLVMVLGLFVIIVGLEGKAITDLFQKVSNLVQFRK